MAGFGNENDIKITVALDTESAIQSAEELKKAVETSLKGFQDQFKKIESISKQANAVLIADIQSKEKIQLQALANEAAADRRRHAERLAQIDPEVAKTRYKYQSAAREAQNAAQQEIAAAERAAQEKIKADQREADNAIKLKQLEVRAAEAAAREFAAQESTKRTDALKTIAEINQATAKIKKTRVGDLGDTAGSGKLIEGLKNSIAALSVQFGNVNVGFGAFINNFKNLGAAGASVSLVTAAVGAVIKFNKALDETATQAGKLEGLKTGFETLQRSIGQSPTKSIEDLRKATQGLISDVDLYQRANQAVLLGVPTKVFNEAAAAAVKLGRAMGIDASFGLESLSLGLGRQSRLYLDNLGIIVSAEEAYRNFASTVGKSVNDLDDAEKKAAFFAEALKKIKERADELPDPLDTVAIAQTKANVAEENANKIRLEAFNNTRALTEQYIVQQKLAETNAKTAYVYGAALAEVGAISKGIANGVSQFWTLAKIGVAGALDAIFSLSPEKQIEALNAKIAESERRVQELNRKAQESGGLGIIARGNAAELRILNQELETDRKELERLKNILGELDGKNIKIKIDLTGIETAQQNIKTVFEGIAKEAEGQAGVFKISGLPDEQAAAIFKRYEEAKKEFDLSIQDTTALNKFKGVLKDIEAEVTGAPIKDAAKDLATNASNLITALSSGSLGKAKEALSGVGESLSTVNKAARATVLGVKDLGNGITGINKRVSKSISELRKDQRDSTKDLKNQERQLKELTRSLGRALDKAIPVDIQKQLVDVFNDPQNSAEELQAKIQAIGEAFLKAEGDYQAFAKEVSELNKLKNEAPGTLIQGSSKQQNALNETSKKLQELKKQSLDIRSILFGKKDAQGNEAGGAFFGFDVGGIKPEGEAELAGQVQDFFATAFQAGVDGFAREDVPQIAAGAGALIGGGLAAYFSGGDPSITAAGAQAGAAIGSAFASVFEAFGKDLEGTKERKSIDKYFATLFDGDRLAVVIQGQLTGAIDEATGAAIRSAQPQLARISDLVFEGITPFAGDVEFGGEDFSNYFNTLSAEVQNSFNGIGIALGSLLGVSEETVRLIGTAIANNIGGELQNLQVLIQQTGESFEDLSKAILKAFRDSQITAEEAYNALVQLQNIYAEGIPGAIGDFQQAIENLNTSLENNQPGQYALDSLRDIGAEGEEARASFETVVSSLGQTFGFAADQQARLFEALRLSGINSLQQLAKASDEQLITLLRNINAIRQNAEAPLAAAPVLPSTSSGGGGGRREKSAAEIAAELLKKQREEARKLTQDSQEYLKIIEKINAGQLTNVEAGKAIVKINNDILNVIRQRDSVEKKLNEELDKGAKGNAKTIGELSKKLAELEERLQKVKEKAAENKREYKDLDISGVMPLIRSQNTLGLVARQIGVSLEKNVDILVKGFLQGRLSIKQVNDEINKTKELLGPGIPNSVGAVTDAFQNLIDAGTKGGQFSVDAFTDICAEYRDWETDRKSTRLNSSHRL